MRYPKVIFVVLAAVISLSAWSKDYYVSPKGKSLENAFKSISKEKGEVRLILSGGDYFISSPLILKDLKGVTIEAAPGDEPVIRGDRIIKGIEPWKDGILQVSLKSLGIKDLGEACVKANLVDLYWKGERQRIAAYPDDGFLAAGEAKGPTQVDEVTREEGIFTYKDELIDSWADEKDAWIYAYFRWDWRDDYQKVSSIDPRTKTITLEAPWHHYGYKDGFKFRGVNIFSGLDSPGEYYIDREKGVLYWYPPQEYAPGDEVSLSVLNSEFMMEIADCENVKIKGLTFVGGRRSALGVSECEGMAIEGVKAFRFGSDALHVDASHDVKITGCHFGTLGHSGMRLSGGDRKTLSSSGYVVSNTIVENISLFRHTYEPSIWFTGCGLTVTHCDFSRCPSSALNLGGNDILVEYNYFHDLVQESDDQRGIDIFYNYSLRGVVVRYNLWENIRGGSLHGSAGVRFDDMISGQLVYGNIFKNVGGGHFGGVQIHGGKDNVVENNLFYNCNIGVSFSPWGQEKWEEALTRPEVIKKLYEDVDINGNLYRSRYPDLAKDIHSDVDRNIIVNNLMVGCRGMFYDDKGQNYMKNNHGISIGENPVMESLEYYLDPKVLESFGLKPIPFREIGMDGRRPLDL
ncbi:MAG: right-handed parallel beta-helix repeat-containing protein [Bacteroidales bacterium]|nr:right-handed parallel beta-helix repeat-containing protein [Bacteroidales bacterium]MBP3269845.1 right-handed parallel beta-helix repeat-containing protein [Bacteroidales bacterium]